MDFKKTFNSVNTPLDRIREIRNDLHSVMLRNTTDMWVDSLEYTLECVVLESVDMECMGEDENDPDNYDHHPDKLPEDKSFNGGDIYFLLQLLDRELFPEEYKRKEIPPKVQFYWDMKKLDIAYRKVKGA